MKNKSSSVFKKCVMWGIPLVIIGILVWLIFENGHKNKEFLTAPLISIMSLITVILVSFYLVQLKNERSKKNEKINYLLTKIQNIILSENFIKYKTADEIQNTNVLFRTIGNKIQLLREYKGGIIDESSFDTLNDNFVKLKEFFGNHMNDSKYLDDSTKEIENYISIIDDTCDKLHMKLL